MKVVGWTVLDDLGKGHADVRDQIAAWLAEVEEAHWKTPQDIKNRYPSASIISKNRVVFNLKGNKYRVDTKIAFRTQVVLILRAGTHREYDNWEF